VASPRVKYNKQYLMKILNNPEILKDSNSIVESDGEGNTLLHLLTKVDYHENMQAVLEIIFENCQINPCLQNKNGNTPLHLFLYSAIRKGCFDNVIEDFEMKHDIPKKQRALSYEQLNYFNDKILQSFDYSIKNKNGISCAQLLVIYKTKILFQLDELFSCVKTNNANIMTKELFKDRLLNPIFILNDYKKEINNVIKKEKDTARLLQLNKALLKLDQLIHDLEVIKIRLLNPRPSFFQRLFGMNIGNEEKLSQIPGRIKK
jgi:hypothetical protein